MGLSSSLSTSVMGLSVNATELSAISDNIANSNTLGYKRVNTDFSDLVLSGTQSSRSYTSGGVRATVTRDVNTAGPLESTTSALDIAIGGRGFIAVTPTPVPSNFSPSSDAINLTSTGSFRTDEAGFVKTPQGQYLLGWKLSTDGTPTKGSVSRDSFSSLEMVNVNDIRFSATPTTSIAMHSNFNASDTSVGSTAPDSEVPITYYNNLGYANTLTMRFTPTPSTSTTGATVTSNSWTLSILDSASRDATNNPDGLVGQFTVNFSDASGSGGTLLPASAGTALVAATAGTSTTVASVNGGGAVVPASANATYDPSKGLISVNTPTGLITVNIGTPGSHTGIQQYSGPFTPGTTEKDGSGFSNLTNFKIDEKGMMNAIFENGTTRPLYQIPVVNVVNTDGLIPVGDSSFSVSPNAGGLYLWNSGEGPVGKVNQYALMKSNADVAKELTLLIETQRSYSSNAKVVQTVDEMMQSTTDMKR